MAVELRHPQTRHLLRSTYDETDEAVYSLEGYRQNNTMRQGARFGEKLWRWFLGQDTREESGETAFYKGASSFVEPEIKIYISPDTLSRNPQPALEVLKSRITRISKTETTTTETTLLIRFTPCEYWLADDRVFLPALHTSLWHLPKPLRGDKGVLATGFADGLHQDMVFNPQSLLNPPTPYHLKHLSDWTVRAIDYKGERLRGRSQLIPTPKIHPHYHGLLYASDGSGADLSALQTLDDLGDILQWSEKNP